MIPNKILNKILQSGTHLTKSQIKKLKRQARSEHEPLEEILISEHAFTEEGLYKLVAEYFNLPFLSLKDKIVSPKFLDYVDESVAIQKKLATFAKTKKGLYLAISLPPDEEFIAELKRKVKIPIQVVFTDPSSIKSLHGQYSKDIELELEKLQKYSEDLDITKMFDAIMEKAILDQASDVHIEPTMTATLVRYRIDGVMREIVSLPRSLHTAVMARIKVVANLRVDEHRLPQDGRYGVVAPDYKVSVRVSIVPIAEGEKGVLRILPEKQRFLSLEELGLLEKTRKKVEKNMKTRQGMVLVVGPTGSGKTTTLYTLLNMINSPEVNISSIEDPIEYSIHGVNQSQVKPRIGYTFAVGLRAFLRQDPDAIMVGEMRDKETAEIALRATLTGHLVLSTLHTNDAARTLPRLTQMGVERYLIPPTITMIIAQRLARKICPSCSTKVKLNGDIKKEIEELTNKPFQQFLKSTNLTPKQINLKKSNGCNECNMTGYKGRIGIYEVLENSPELQSAILVGAFAKEIMEIAVRQGMVPMIEDGVKKALVGITTIEELIRVM